MQSLPKHDLQTAATKADGALAVDAELSILRGVFKMLPAGVTVQDEQGRFLLVNDLAAAQLGIAVDGAGAPDSKELTHRRETGLELLRTGRPAVAEEWVTDGEVKKLLLTAHRPVRIGDRDLLLSSSADITARKALEDQLFRSAYHDELTGLPARRVIEHRADNLLQHDQPRARFALAFLDIDNFKHINDYYGHAIGDALLVEVAKRVGLDLRESDMLSRISGDEFLLLLNPIQSEHEVAEYMHFVLQRLRAPFFIDGSEIFASTSIGVSFYPEHGRSFDELCQNADIAMYCVKNDGKGAVAFFDASMEREALARMKVEQSLRLAILEKRFCCAFQAKVDIRTQDIKGIEALVRLRDDGGIIQAPGTFINLAAKQAGNPDFMRAFAQALEATGYPARFMIEVTEDAFVAKTHFQTEILPMFRKLGVRVSIDDFGIGYSSLSALADITADEIKIDRSFITDIHKRPRSQGILRAIESLSEALGMTVVAEGIETFEELAYLQAATKIRYAQGFYFSRPIFLEELKPPVRMLSHARPSAASRPLQENRSVCSRGDRHRR